MNLGGAAQKLEIYIGAKDEASSVFRKVQASAADAFGGTRGVGFWGSRASIAIAGIGVAGVAAGGAMLALANKVSAAGEEIYDASLRTGVATEKLSALKFAAEQSGTTLGAVELAMKRLSVAANSAGDGNKAAADKFKELGVEVVGADGKLRNVSDIFDDVTSALSTMTDTTKKTALAVELFGRSGNEMLPMLDGGKEGIKALEAEARKLGLTWDTEGAKKADAYGDAVGSLKGAMGGLEKEIGELLIPALTSLATATTSVVVQTKNLIGDIKKDPWDIFIATIASLTGQWGLYGVAMSDVLTKTESVGDKTRDAAGKITPAVKGIGTDWDTFVVGKMSPFLKDLPANAETSFSNFKTNATTHIAGVKGSWALTETSITTGLDGLPTKMDAKFKQGSDSAVLQLERVGSSWAQVAGSLKLDMNPIVTDIKAGWPTVQAEMEANLTGIKMRPWVLPDPQKTSEEMLAQASAAVDLMEPVKIPDSKLLWPPPPAQWIIDVQAQFATGDFKAGFGAIGKKASGYMGEELTKGLTNALQTAFGDKVSTTALGQTVASAGAGAIQLYGMWVVGKVMGGIGEALRIQMHGDEGAGKKWAAYVASQEEAGAPGFANPAATAGFHYEYDERGNVIRDAQGNKIVFQGPDRSQNKSGGGGGMSDEDYDAYQASGVGSMVTFDEWMRRRSGGGPSTETPGLSDQQKRSAAKFAVQSNLSSRAYAVGMPEYDMAFWRQDAITRMLDSDIENESNSGRLKSEGESGYEDWVVREGSKIRDAIWVASSPGTLNPRFLAMARGGLVSSPTRMIAGEQGSEWVINNKGMQALKQLNEGDAQGVLGGAGGNIYINLVVQALDKSGVVDTVVDTLGPRLRDYLLSESRRGIDVVYSTGVRAA